VLPEPSPLESSDRRVLKIVQAAAKSVQSQAAPGSAGKSLTYFKAWNLSENRAVVKTKSLFTLGFVGAQLRGRRSSSIAKKVVKRHCD